jgi:hypothetical protein
MDYDSCNEDTAALTGIKQYCLQLFSRAERLSAFHFWGEPELREGCETVAQKESQLPQQAETDKCQMLDEAMFTLYHQTQMGVLAQILATSKDLITRKRNKEMQLRALVDDANSDE